MWGRLVFTQYKTGCLRNILLQSRGVREGDIQEKYKILGAANEERFEKTLLEAGDEFKREVPIKTPIAANPSIILSGRADFVRTVNGSIIIDELKSTDSKTKLRDVIKNGRWVVENLAQLVCYMIEFKTTMGRLIYTYMEPEGGVYTAKKERAFETVIDDAGRICIDLEPTKFTAQDQIAHRNAAAKVILTGEVWERPYDWNVAFKSPCAYCSFAPVCDRYDNGEIEGTDAFVLEANRQLSKGAKNDDTNA